MSDLGSEYVGDMNPVRTAMTSSAIESTQSQLETYENLLLNKYYRVWGPEGPELSEMGKALSEMKEQLARLIVKYSLLIHQCPSDKAHRDAWTQLVEAELFRERVEFELRGRFDTLDEIHGREAAIDECEAELQKAKDDLAERRVGDEIPWTGEQAESWQTQQIRTKLIPELEAKLAEARAELDRFQEAS